MGYAIRKDGQGQRFVESAADIDDEVEIFSEHSPHDPAPLAAGFAVNALGAWRAVSSDAELAPGETFSAEAPADTAPAAPSPQAQIRALEAQYADAQAKLTRQSLLALALDKACALPAAANMTRQQVHVYLMGKDSGYKALFDLEEQVAALRAQL